MSNNRRRGPMGGPGRGMAPGEKAKDLKGTMVKLIKYMRRFYVPIVMVIIFAIASTVFNIVGPTILGDATTEIFKGLVRKVSGGSGIDFDKVKHILLMLLSLYVASAIFSFIQGLIMTHVSNNVSYQMRKDISEKIHRMPMKYFESRTYGEVLSRVTNDVDTLGQSLNQSMTQIITSTTQIVGVFIMMIRISIPMTIAVLLTLPLSMGLIGLIMSKSQPYFKAQQKHLGELNGQVEEIYSGHNIVKAFNKEESVIEESNANLKQNPYSKNSKNRLKVATMHLEALHKREVEAKKIQGEYKEELPLAAAMYITYGIEKVYLMSGSNDTYKSFRGPYALQWYMIQKAIDEHLDYYNFYGISGLFHPGDEGYGVFDFKRGFNAQVVELVGNFILPIHPILFKLYNRLRHII